MTDAAGTTIKVGGAPALPFPTFFKAELKGRANGTPMVQIPCGGQRTIKFSTDVENQYFDRVSDPGDLSVGLLRFCSPGRGGHGRLLPNRVDEVFNLVKSSPSRGTINHEVSCYLSKEIGKITTTDFAIEAHKRCLSVRNWQLPDP